MVLIPVLEELTFSGGSRKIIIGFVDLSLLDFKLYGDSHLDAQDLTRGQRNCCARKRTNPL
ncbi:MAG: hypothetical protein QGF78_01495 [Candidatus Bathyarchaeota archaeon]|nr:hypothetical protein [Candidatus Bathyarchaeota archaeon]